MSGFIVKPQIEGIAAGVEVEGIETSLETEGISTELHVEGIVSEGKRNGAEGNYASYWVWDNSEYILFDDGSEIDVG